MLASCKDMDSEWERLEFTVVGDSLDVKLGKSLG